MKKLALCILVVMCLLSGCAGLDHQYQRNMAINSGIWGGIGAGVGAAIGALAGDPVSGAVIGGLAGAGLGAANTPSPYPRYYYYSAEPVIFGPPVYMGPGVFYRARYF